MHDGNRATHRRHVALRGTIVRNGEGPSTAMESPLPGTRRDDRRRGPSEVALRQNPPSPGTPRRPLPGRERRLFVAALETVRTLFFSLQANETPLRRLTTAARLARSPTHSSPFTLSSPYQGEERGRPRSDPANEARPLSAPLGGGEGAGEVGAKTSLHDTTDPHPALRAGLSLAREKRLFSAWLGTRELVSPGAKRTNLCLPIRGRCAGGTDANGMRPLSSPEGGGEGRKIGSATGSVMPRACALKGRGARPLREEHVTLSQHQDAKRARGPLLAGKQA